MPNLDRGLYASLEALMDHVVDTFTTAGFDLPDRRIIVAGDEEDTPHDDCGQLVVNFAQLYNGVVGQPLQEPSKCDNLWVVVAGVSLVLCTPTPIRTGRTIAPPTADAVIENTKIQARAAELLLAAGLSFCDEQFYGGPGGLGDIQIGSNKGGSQQITLSIAYALV